MTKNLTILFTTMLLGFVSLSSSAETALSQTDLKTLAEKYDADGDKKYTDGEFDLLYLGVSPLLKEKLGDMIPEEEYKTMLKFMVTKNRFPGPIEWFWFKNLKDQTIDHHIVYIKLGLYQLLRLESKQQ